MLSALQECLHSASYKLRRQGTFIDCSAGWERAEWWVWSNKLPEAVLLRMCHSTRLWLRWSRFWQRRCPQETLLLVCQNLPFPARRVVRCNCGWGLLMYCRSRELYLTGVRILVGSCWKPSGRFVLSSISSWNLITKTDKTITAQAPFISTVQKFPPLKEIGKFQQTTTPQNTSHHPPVLPQRQ